jgi:flagellar hook-associated protein 3 FlgL
VRVTDKMIFERAGTGAARARDRAAGAAEELSSGVRVRHPGDDPAAAGLVVGHRLAAGRFAAIGTVAARASQEIFIADSALGELGTRLDRARELAVQFSNDTYSAAERATAATELRTLLGQTLALLNTRAGDRYVFGGTRDDVPPFDQAGNYLGASAPRRLEIAPGVLEDASITGAAVAKGPVDLPGTLSALAAALSANDVTAIRASLDPLAGATAQVSTARGRLGASMNVFDAAAEAARSAEDAENATAGALIDADTVSAAGRLALAQRALDAALTTSARSFELTLLDKLR